MLGLKTFIRLNDFITDRKDCLKEVDEAIKKKLTPEAERFLEPVFKDPQKVLKDMQTLVDAYINTDKSKPKVNIEKTVGVLIKELNDHNNHNSFEHIFQVTKLRLEQDLGEDVAKLAMDVLDAGVTNVAIRKEYDMIKHEKARDIAEDHVTKAEAKVKAEPEKAQAEKAIEEAEKRQAEKVAEAQEKLVKNLELIEFSDTTNLSGTIGEKNAKHFIESREELRKTLQEYKDTKDIKKLGNFDEKVSTLEKWCNKEIEKNKTKEGVKGFFQKVGDLIKGYDREKAQTQLVGLKEELKTIKDNVKGHTSDFDKASKPAPTVKSTSSGRSV